MLEIRPNFFIVGAPKCGTTSLDEYLRQHPNVFISRPKEPHYFSTDLNNRVIKSFEEYISLYKSVDPDKHIAIGEASASYLFSKNALINIKKFNPKAKIIVMLRKQIDLLPSYHSQMIAAGQENILDFETAWNAEKQRIKGKKIPFACKEKKVLEYSKWGLFSDQIKRLFSLFSKDQIKIIMFDEFKNNPKKVFGEIIHFLNLKNFENITFDRHNENKIVRNIIFQQVLIFFSSKLTILKSYLNIKYSFGLYTKLLSFNTYKNKRKALDKNFINKLNDFYRDDINKLSKLIKRDLQDWIL